MTLKRFVAAVAVLAGTTALLVPSASADPPTRVPAPFTDLSGPWCPGFDVNWHAVTNNEVATFFSDGRVIVTGTFKIDVTNMSSGKTVTVNASGPVFVSSDGNTVVLRGNTLLGYSAGEVGPGSAPFTQLVSGVVTVKYAADGSVASLTRTGHVTDLCAALAAP
jgi:hypothetical protein